MLQISTWSRVVTILVLLLGIVIALPNALPESALKNMPSWWPTGSVTLGLDLQGGSYMLMEVDYTAVEKDKGESLLAEARVRLRKARIGYEDIQAANGVFSVRIIDQERFDEAKKILTELNPTVSGSVLAIGAREYEMTEPGNGRIVMTTTDAFRVQNKSEVVSQSIEVIRRRIDELGTREPTITRQGDDRILIQVPGLSDPTELLKLLGKTAKMTFQLVDEAADIQQAEKGIVPIGSELLYLTPTADEKARGEKRGQPIVVQRRVMVSGDHLNAAAGTFNQQTGQPVVTFRFDTVGARQFGDVTKANVGRRFAVVLDNEVITAPVIRDAILGGSGEISGSFTVQSANELAALLRAGALPAPLKVLDQRTVGAELGKDSVEAGKYSAIGGLILVALFMIARYGLFGLFADVALTMNVVLLMAALTLFGATLTLPGIAGIVLTMGMAVDANVLIYERIREEVRNGRTLIAAIDAGFRRAMATIVDANATHLIASLILFQLGSGPVRGFAVTLGLGIITSFFTAVMVTRMMVVWWLRAARPKKLAM
ncbi:MAG: protein translocase subunit SecD [Alphaproteobacteria bacterium]|nr:protein translocase subunit SecD [Alphaproteobacteria bacterium]